MVHKGGAGVCADKEPAASACWVEASAQHVEAIQEEVAQKKGNLCTLHSCEAQMFRTSDFSLR